MPSPPPPPCSFFWVYFCWRIVSSMIVCPAFRVFFLVFILFCESCPILSGCAVRVRVRDALHPFCLLGHGEQGQAGGADGDLPLDVRRVRGGDQGDLSDHPRKRRPGEMCIYIYLPSSLLADWCSWFRQQEHASSPACVVAWLPACLATFVPACLLVCLSG